MEVDGFMKKTKRARLEKLGWKFGTVAEFLGLSHEEEAFVEMKLALSRKLKEQRKKNRMSQENLARLVKSSQSRVAKMEAGDPSVSMDLVIRSLLTLGASPKVIGRSLSLHK